MVMPVEVLPGSHVVTADGAELGTVKRVEDAAFLVDVRGDLDFWLKHDDVSEVGDGVVRMAFPRAALDAYSIRFGDVL